MEISIFGSTAELIESTSAVVGKRAAAVIDHNKKVWGDLFLWDPMNGMVQFDRHALYPLLLQQRRKTSPWLGATLWLTDGAISLVKGIRRMTGGSYGGTFGYGDFGSIMAMGSAVVSVMFAIAAAIVLAPLIILGWCLRQWINHELVSESQRVVDQVGAFFAQRPSNQA